MKTTKRNTTFPMKLFEENKQLNIIATVEQPPTVIAPGLQEIIVEGLQQGAWGALITLGFIGFGVWHTANKLATPVAQYFEKFTETMTKNSEGIDRIQVSNEKIIDKLDSLERDVEEVQQGIEHIKDDLRKQ